MRSKLGSVFVAAGLLGLASWAGPVASAPLGAVPKTSATSSTVEAVGYRYSWYRDVDDDHGYEVRTYRRGYHPYYEPPRRRVYVPAPVYVAPPPVVVYPAPVTIYPAPVRVYPPPTVAYPPPLVVYPGNTYAVDGYRPSSCGVYRYWDGDRCVDARRHKPYIGPRY
ncbi:MAG: hypothetical protein ACOYLQ_20480 [Hyphomicrobiaceae bacterium]